MAMEEMGTLVTFELLSSEAAGMIKQTNIKSDTLVLSFRLVLRLAIIQIIKF